MDEITELTLLVSSAQMKVTEALLKVVKVRANLKRKMKSIRRWWVKPHLRDEIRFQLGLHHNLFRYFELKDPEEFFRFTSLSVEQFQCLHQLLKPKLTKMGIRPSLSSEFRLAVVLNFLAKGDSLSSTAWSCKIGLSTIYKLVPEVCEALWEVLKTLYLRFPQTESEWTQIADEFQDQWNFPNCLGVIDGKHVRVKAPPNSGSSFLNYKGYHSIVLLAVCDARYRFLYVDIGSYGSANVSSIWGRSKLGTSLQDGTLHLPESGNLPGTEMTFPYAFVANEGFPLTQHLMCPYSQCNLVNNTQRIFNYRVSRVRNSIENAFGVLAEKWRVLHGCLGLHIKNCKLVVQATVCLHNFAISTDPANEYYLREGLLDSEDFSGIVTDGSWRTAISDNFVNIEHPSSNAAQGNAVTLRNYLAEYFVSEEGSLPWQWEQI